MKEVEFSGNKKFSSSQIKDKLKEAKAEVHVGAPMSLRDVARARSAIADYYSENGYRSATVDFKIEDVSKTEKKIIFNIDEGDKIKIAAIKFQGNKVFSAAEPAQRDEEDEGEHLVAVPLGREHHLRAGELRRGRREPARALPIQGIQERRHQGPGPRRLRQEPEGACRPSRRNA